MPHGDQPIDRAPASKKQRAQAQRRSEIYEDRSARPWIEIRFLDPSNQESQRRCGEGEEEPDRIPQLRDGRALPSYKALMSPSNGGALVAHCRIARHVTDTCLSSSNPAPAGVSLDPSSSAYGHIRRDRDLGTVIDLLRRTSRRNSYTLTTRHPPRPPTHGALGVTGIGRGPFRSARTPRRPWQSQGRTRLFLVFPYLALQSLQRLP
jgi:hypothetical protein